MLVLLIGFLPMVTAQAQPDPRKQALEQLRQFRKQLLIEKLALNEEEQRNFLPVYEAYKEEDRLLVSAFKKKYPKNSVIYMTEEQAKIYLDELTKLKDAQWQLQKNYMIKFLAVLSAKKVAMLPQAEKEIQVAVKLKARQLRQRPGSEESIPSAPDEE
ncbi:MAG: hypothetical protein RL160_1502 [Bacteroidota bacterium]|jgi:anion-transporting  ArsA/GET3 family ATPase